MSWFKKYSVRNMVLVHKVLHKTLHKVHHKNQKFIIQNKKVKQMTMKKKLKI